MALSGFEILFLLVIFLTNILQALTGFAGTAVAMPFSRLLVGDDTAKAVLNVVALGICLCIVIHHYKEIDAASFMKMVFFLFVGLMLGILIEQVHVPSSIARRVYGAIVIAISIVLFFLPLEKFHLPNWVLALILVLAGIVHEFFVSGGPLVVIYAAFKFKDKHEFRATLSLLWIVLNLALFGRHLDAGYFSAHVWWLLLLGAVLSGFSFLIGHFLAHKVSHKAFMKIAYVLLFISGVVMLL